MQPEEIAVFLFTLLILAGVAVLWMAMQSRRRIREMEHRERLAMIDRGLIPSPELDPAGFERHAGLASTAGAAGSRSRSFGIILIGLGLGLTMLISFAAEEPSIGIGVGGACAVLGAAFLANAMVANRPDEYHRPSSQQAWRRPVPGERPDHPPDPGK